MKTHLLTLSAALLLLPTTALAAPASTTRNDEGAAVREQDGGVRELIFDESDNVDGEVMSPNGVDVGGNVATVHASMITIRGQFTNHLIWLSNDI